MWVGCQLQVVLCRIKVSVSRCPIFISGAVHVQPASGMTAKIIHFMVNGKLEQAEFGGDCSAADVKGKPGGLELFTTDDFRDIVIL